MILNTTITGIHKYSDRVRYTGKVLFQDPDHRLTKPIEGSYHYDAFKDIHLKPSAASSLQYPFTVQGSILGSHIQQFVDDTLSVFGPCNLCPLEQQDDTIMTTNSIPVEINGNLVGFLKTLVLSAKLADSPSWAMFTSDPIPDTRYRYSIGFSGEDQLAKTLGVSFFHQADNLTGLIGSEGFQTPPKKSIQSIYLPNNYQTSFAGLKFQKKDGFVDYKGDAYTVGAINLNGSPHLIVRKESFNKPTKVLYIVGNISRFLPIENSFTPVNKRVDDILSSFSRITLGGAGIRSIVSLLISNNYVMRELVKYCKLYHLPTKTLHIINPLAFDLAEIRGSKGKLTELPNLKGQMLTLSECYLVLPPFMYNIKFKLESKKDVFKVGSKCIYTSSKGVPLVQKGESVTVKTLFDKVTPNIVEITNSKGESMMTNKKHLKLVVNENSSNPAPREKVSAEPFYIL